MSYFIVNREELSRSGDTYEFEGYLYGNTKVSVILVDLPREKVQSCMPIPMKRSFSFRKAARPIRLARPLLKPGQGKLRLFQRASPTNSSIRVRVDSGRWTFITALSSSRSGWKTESSFALRRLLVTGSPSVQQAVAHPMLMGAPQLVAQDYPGARKAKKIDLS